MHTTDSIVLGIGVVLFVVIGGIFVYISTPPEVVEEVVAPEASTTTAQ